MMVTRLLNNIGDPIVDGANVPRAGIGVVFVLVDAKGKPSDAWDAISEDYINPGPITTTTDADGLFSVSLWPTTRGDRPVFWECSVDLPYFSKFKSSIDVGATALQWFDFRFGADSGTAWPGDIGPTIGQAIAGAANAYAPRMASAEERIAAVELGQSSAVVGYATLALLAANLTPDDGAIAYVTNDTTPGNNGTYRKVGATGGGSWVASSFDRVLQLEYFVKGFFVNTGATQIDVAGDVFTFSGLRFGKADGTFVDGSGTVITAGGVHDYIVANIGSSAITVEAGLLAYPWMELPTLGTGRVILMYKEFGRWNSSHPAIKTLLDLMTKNIFNNYFFGVNGGMSFDIDGNVTISTLRYISPRGYNVDLMTPVTIACIGAFDYLIASVSGSEIAVAKGTLDFPWYEPILSVDSFVLAFKNDGKWTSAIPAVLAEIMRNFPEPEINVNAELTWSGDTVTVSGRWGYSSVLNNWIEAAPTDLTIPESDQFSYIIANLVPSGGIGTATLEVGALLYPWMEAPLLNNLRQLFAYKNDGMWHSPYPNLEVKLNELQKKTIECMTASFSYGETSINCYARYSNGTDAGWYEAGEATLATDPTELYESLILTLPDGIGAPAFGTFTIETTPHFYFNQQPSLTNRRILFAYKNDGVWTSTIPAVVRAIHEFKYHDSLGFTVTEKIVKAGGTPGTDCDYTDIKSALDAITDNSAANRYVLRVKNGVYDVSTDGNLYLGFKNYVDLIGQTRNGVKVIKRIASDDPAYSTFDLAFYNQTINYASLRNMTIISHNSKCPVHIDGPQLDGTIELIGCNLINENVSGQQNYQNGLACGLRQNQHVIVRGCYTNGKLWAHNLDYHYPGDGCSFELYNCISKFVVVGDLLSYGKDHFVMEGCKTEFFQFLFYKGWGTSQLPYFQPSFDFALKGNVIEYVEAVTTTDGGATTVATGWDELFGGKHSICDGSIHNYCKNVSGSTITKGDKVKLDPSQDMNGVTAWTTGAEFYGVALDTILAGEFGVVQYQGTIFLPADGTATAIAFNDPLEINGSGNVVKRTSGDIIGRARGTLSGSTGSLKIKMVSMN